MLVHLWHKLFGFPNNSKNTYKYKIFKSVRFLIKFSIKIKFLEFFYINKIIEKMSIKKIFLIKIILQNKLFDMLLKIPL